MRDTQYLRRLFNRQSAEEAQFDDLALPRVERGQAAERFVERNQVGILRLGLVKRFVERQTRLAAPALVRLVAARVIHQDAAHQLRGNADEVSAVSPVDALVNQPQEGFIDQGRGLQRV